MLQEIFFAFWFFGPVGLANVSAFFSSKIPIVKKFNYPVDGGLMLRKKRLLGSHKTIRGFIFGIFMAILGVYLQIFMFENFSFMREILPINYSAINPVAFGFLCGFGALVGDAIKSFFNNSPVCFHLNSYSCSNFSFSNFDIEKMAHDAIRQYQVTSSRKRILLEVHDPGKPMPPVHADQDRTRQVLINLIGNALKFTEHGVVTVSFSTDGNFVKVSVSDSGKGIPYDAQERLFRKFEQAGSTVLTRDSVRGTGLGLYISKMIMEQMKGSIRLESSTPGVGTTFSFSLPIAGGDKTAHASSTQTET